jgi:predicted outer membrane repeat protein
MRKEKRILLFRLAFLFLTFVFIATGCGKEIGTAPPDTSITSGPSDPTNQSSATFWFIAIRPFCTFECQMDGGGYTSCTSPKTYDGLLDGRHTFEVRATHRAGKTDPTPASYIWTIDTQPPDNPVAYPAGGSYCPTTVTLTASDGTIYYTTDGSGPTTGSLVFTVPIDISVDTTLKFIAVDVCGNQSATVTEVYDIDTEVVIIITSPVDGDIVSPGDVMVSGTADTDIPSVSLGATQGIWTDTNPAVSGGVWSSTLKDLAVDTTVTITVMGTDKCGNDGSDSIAVDIPIIWYVNITATGNNNGTSWEDAFSVVQDGVNAASGGHVVFVAEGTYTNSPNPLTASVLTMAAGVEVYGGFTATEIFLSDRGDPATHPIILDGDNASYHVVVGASNARLDGFTITGGNANGSGNNTYGGGMFNDNVTGLVVANCTFSGNSATGTFGRGGGMYNYNCSPKITNCTFSVNWGTLGGGILNYENSSPTITNCTFVGNSADYGGGICNIVSPPIGPSQSSPTITNCTFSGNSATNYGGGIYNSLSSPTITNCTFSSNSADLRGAGMYNSLSSPTITNCTFVGNTATKQGGGIYNLYYSSPTISNCIMWGDTAPTGPEISLHSSDYPSTLNISHSDLQGGQVFVYVDPGCTLNWGTGMIGELPEDNPLFETGFYGNYYLRQPPDQDPPISPCVNAGSDTAENLGLDNRTTSTNGDLDTGWVDMGYHYEP